MSSSKTLLTLRQLHLPLIHLQKDLLDIMEKLWPKRTIISFTPDQIQFFIFLFYFLFPSLLLQLLISVQQSWRWDQPQSPGINSMPTFKGPLSLPHLQSSISLNSPRIPLSFGFFFFCFVFLFFNTLILGSLTCSGCRVMYWILGNFLVATSLKRKKMILPPPLVNLILS